MQTALSCPKARPHAAGRSAQRPRLRAAPCAQCRISCRVQTQQMAAQHLRRRRSARAQAGSDTASESSVGSSGAGASSNGSGYDEDDDSEEALEAKMQEFLRQQAMQESGEAYIAPASAGDVVLGKEVVAEQEARQYCGQVRDMIKMLKSNRDMAFNEIKLTVMIEDPRARERRETLGIEEDSGVSRDELAAALTEVAEGRIPKDRVALRELAREMAEWPYADLSNDSRLSQIDESGPADEAEQGILRPKKLMGRDKNEKPQGIEDLLPEWMGYGALYAVSAAPIVIGVIVVVTLFLNSVK